MCSLGSLSASSSCFPVLTTRDIGITQAIPWGRRTCPQHSQDAQEESGTPRAMGGHRELSLNLGLWGGSLKEVTSELRFEGLGGVKGQVLEG